MKRESVNFYLKELGQDERKVLRDMGVKFGRYHIFLHRLFKPEAVLLRILLWKNFHQKFFNLNPPIFGLNFLERKNSMNNNFMLLCGFEKFGNFFVRIDILERLFVKIINSDSKKKNEIKLDSEMLNLLGCSKENFLKLINSMSYKTYKKEDDIYFKYMPTKQKINKNYKNIKNVNNPFSVLKKLTLNK